MDISSNLNSTQQVAILNIKKQANNPAIDVPLVSPALTQAELNISAEAQYLFKMDVYLSGLDKDEQSRAVGVLAASEEPLHQLVAKHYAQSQDVLEQFSLDQRSAVHRISEEMDKKGHMLGADFVLTDDTKVVMIPLACEQFRLDEKQNAYAVQLNERNVQLNKQLDVFEPVVYSALDNQDAANLVGSVRHLLNASETIQLAFDDVLYFQYTLEKANLAIQSLAAPSEIKSALGDIVKNATAYQNQKQIQFIAVTNQFIGSGSVGQLASTDVKMAAATQHLNTQLSQQLRQSKQSLLDSASSLKDLLSDNTDLIRFSPQKLDEALNFYKNDMASFKRVLVQDYSQPSATSPSVINTRAAVAGDTLAADTVAYLQKAVF